MSFPFSSHATIVSMNIYMLFIKIRGFFIRPLLHERIKRFTATYPCLVNIDIQLFRKYENLCIYLNHPVSNFNKPSHIHLSPIPHRHCTHAHIAIPCNCPTPTLGGERRNHKFRAPAFRQPGKIVILAHSPRRLHRINNSISRRRAFSLSGIIYIHIL